MLSVHVHNFPQSGFFCMAVATPCLVRLVAMDTLYMHAPNSLKPCMLVVSCKPCNDIHMCAPCMYSYQNYTQQLEPSIDGLRYWYMLLWSNFSTREYV